MKSVTSAPFTPRVSFFMWAVYAALSPIGAASHSVSGTVTHNANTMNLKAAVAVWNPAENELRIALVPFVPDSREIERIRRSGTVFVAADRPAPHPGSQDRPPFADLVIEFHPGTTAARPDRVRHYRIEVAWLKRMNFTSTINRNLPEELERELRGLSGSLREGGIVQLSCQGSGSVFDDQLNWDFRVNATVVVKR